MVEQDRKPFKVEALATTLIVAILGAVAVPVYMATVEDPQERACRANMGTIASAEEAWRSGKPGREYTTDLIDLNDHLGALPKCPKGGTYRLKRIGASLSIICSAAKHRPMNIGRK